MNTGIPSREEYLAELDLVSKQAIEQMVKQNPAGLPALLMRIETERMLIETILSLRDVLYNYADIIDAEFKRLRGE